MNLHTYFTADQKAVLKQLLIPAIISTIISLISCYILYRTAYGSMAVTDRLYAYYLGGIQVALIFAWEQVIKKDWIRAFGIFAGYAITHVLFKKLGSLQNPILDYPFLFMLWNCLQTIAICYISGRKNFLQTGLIAGIIINTAYYPINSLLDRFNFMFDPFAAVYGFALAYLIPTWVFLCENYFSSFDLDSKIRPISGREYKLLFGVVSFTSLLTALELGKFVSFIFSYKEYTHILDRQKPLPLLLSLLISGYIIYMTTRMIRNIAISRMMTTADHNGWLYLFHYIPFFNIIPWLVYSSKPSVHTTEIENGQYYISQPTSGISKGIIILGVLSTLFYLSLPFDHLSGQEGALVGLYMIALVIKIALYFYLPKGSKKTVLALVIITVIIAFAQMFTTYGRQAPILSSIIFSISSYYFLIEIFAPSLDEEKNDLAA